MEDFDIVKKKAMFESEPYTRYTNLFHENDIELLKFNQNGLININNMFVKPPKIKNIFEEIEGHIILKQQLSIKYHDIYNEILFSDKPNSLKKEYDDIVNQIETIDKNIDEMYQYYETINNKNYENIVEPLIKKQKILLLQQFQLLESPSVEKNKMSKLARLYKELNEISEKINETKKTISKIDFYIVSLPEFNVKNKKNKDIHLPIKLNVQIIKPVIVEPVKKSPKKGLKVTPKQFSSIKDNVKKLIAEKFKFKTKDECASQKHKQQYYMSKPELIEEIEKNKDLKSLLPANYHKLTKEKICEYLF